MKYLYYSVSQTIAHHTVTGCNLNTGDLLGSGTISGPTKEERGSMLEISWGGKEPVTLPNGEERKFLNDGDSILLQGFAHGDGTLSALVTARVPCFLRLRIATSTD